MTMRRWQKWGDLPMAYLAGWLSGVALAVGPRVGWPAWSIACLVLLLAGACVWTIAAAWAFAYHQMRDAIRRHRARQAWLEADE